MVALTLLTFASGRIGGSEEAVRTLTEALDEQGRRTYLVLAPPDSLDVANGLSVRAAGAPSSRSRVVLISHALASGAALRTADAIHYPLTVPIPRPHRPYAVTLHDVLHLDHPDLVPRLTRTFRMWAYDQAARRADRVIVPSAFVRDRAVVRLGLRPSRIRVIPHAVDTKLFRPAADVGREPFLLYPARLWPHKNHALLFEAFRQVRRMRRDLELVLTGGGHEAFRLPEGVRSLGFVSRQELADLYRRSSALVFPSRYEGFGLPVLEAMASGLPVAAAEIGAIKEVAGDVAVFFPPDSPTEAAAAILEAVDGAVDRSEKGVELARRFSRARLARAHDAVYGELEELR